MNPEYAIQFEFLERLLLAGACGAFIGYERKNRLKEAGIRTHLIVALASALMMIVSKYGFNDLVLLDNVKYDPSRVAANIVSGVGFLGAGMIFIKNQTVSGLTTAAGVWATCGVGMAVGAGMYFIAIAATILIILVQIVLHKNFSWLKIPVAEQINVQILNSSDAISSLQNLLEQKDIQILTIKADKLDDGYLDVEMFAKFPQKYDTADLMSLFKSNPNIKSFEL